MNHELSASLQLELHHVGCVTKNINESLVYYTKVLPFKKSSEVIHIKAQKVSVCFVDMGSKVYLELVEPTNDNKSLNNLLRKGISFYHLGYFSEDVDRSADFLVSKDFRIVTSFYSEAFENKKCVFLYTPEMQLIELIQK